MNRPSNTVADKLAGFTPGPWLIHSTRRWIVPAEHAFMEPGDALPICQLRDPDERLTEDETLNNGFLLAAAPDLYEALITARAALIAIADSAVEAGFDRMADIIDGQLSKANDALAKARGEA